MRTYNNFHQSISRRLLYDALTSSSSSQEDDEITDEFVASCAAAYSSCKGDMEAKKVTDVEVIGEKHKHALKKIF